MMTLSKGLRNHHDDDKIMVAIECGAYTGAMKELWFLVVETDWWQHRARDRAAVCRTR